MLDKSCDGVVEDVGCEFESACTGKQDDCEFFGSSQFQLNYKAFKDIFVKEVLKEKSELI